VRNPTIARAIFYSSLLSKYWYGQNRTGRTARFGLDGNEQILLLKCKWVKFIFGLICHFDFIQISIASFDMAHAYPID